MTAELTSQKRLGNALFYGIVLVLAYLVFLIFQPFLVPLAWAVVLAVVSFPVYAGLKRRFGSVVAAIISTIGVTVVLIVPTLLVMFAFVRQGVDAVQAVQQGIANGHFQWVNDFWSKIQHRFADANPGDLSTVLRRYAEQTAGYVADRLGLILRHTAEFLFHLGVTILAMFYLYCDGERIVARLREVLPFEESHRDRMFHEARDINLRERHVEPCRGRCAWNSGRNRFCGHGHQSADFLGRHDGFFLASSRHRLGHHLGACRR